MRIFNILIMSTGTFRDKLREREKVGHRVALAQLAKADKIIYGDCQILRGKIVKGNICILGDKTLVAHCVFKGSEITLDATIDLR